MGASLRPQPAFILLTIDLIGTALFAAEGAATAVMARLDILGVLVLAFTTAAGGGIVRDLLLGDVPPPSIRNWRYAGIAFAAGALIFLLPISVFGMNNALRVALDAAGLSFFSIAGSTKALDYKLHPLHAVMMGGITGVGGGTIRDLLLNRVPSVLVSDVYATAALLGSAVAVTLIRLKVRPGISSVCGIVACFTLRMVAVHYSWNLPMARQ